MKCVKAGPALATLMFLGCAGGDAIVPGDAAPKVDMATPPPDMMTSVNCGAVTQCGTCASLGPCGWCAATNTCVPGNAQGPSVGACASGWTPTPDRCPAMPDASAPDVATPDVATPDVAAPDVATPDVAAPDVAAPDAPAPDAAAPDASGVDPCAASSACGACTAMASCGFCQSTGRCQTGGRDAPTLGPACPSGWAWLGNQCTAGDAGAGTDATMSDPCASATDCGSCTQRSQCGWCPGSNRCALGTSTGPNTGAATCGTWAWFTGQCGGGSDAGAPDAAMDAAADPCVSATNCTTCTGRSQCGWCPGANRCYVGTSTGPNGTVTSCGSWAWTSSMCGGTADAGTDAPRDTGTDAATDAGMTGVPGFGPMGSFPSADLARACPLQGTMRLHVTRVYATPRDPQGRAWDGVPGVSDFVCNTTADRVRETLRDRVNGIRMGVGDVADQAVGDAFRNVVATQCGTAANWFLGRWEGPDMFANMFSPSSATSRRWNTSTENDSWEAPRQGATWSNAFVEIPCNALTTQTFRLEVRDEDLLGVSERVGEFTFRGDQVSPRAMCTGVAFTEGTAGLAGVLFAVTVRGGTQNCTGLR